MTPIYEYINIITTALDNARRDLDDEEYEELIERVKMEVGE